MNRRTALLAAVVVTAGAAVSACSSSDAAESAPAPVSQAVPTAETAKDPAALAQQWIDVGGTAVPQADAAGIQYGAQPYPGINIGQGQIGTSPNKCTLGPLARRIADGDYVFVTAGHCDEHPGAVVSIWSGPNGEGPKVVGTLAGKLDNDADQDSALLETVLAPTPDATKIAGKFPVARVMPVDEVRKLPAGTPVCVDGARSGVVCRPLIRPDRDTIKYEFVGIEGDSGAPVFLVGTDNRAVLIGILKGEDGLTGLGEATYLAPALDRLGVEIVTG
ncbi:chymotrypsin family serine protease [Mycobacterium dioxanotrophicus]|uniref:hypothetical protein n=1 Tax=Mycobacterium dioxanotrophicus TaxID=482462 RepID=UPI0012FBFAB6|nr:hypothetical protein [Mycobacterium dioxanotrophicus]